MLSNLMVTNQKVVLIIDQLNRERIAAKFIDSLLKEQGQGEEVKVLPIGTQLKHVASIETLLGDNNNPKNAINVILPTLADLLCYHKPAHIFQFINRLRRCEHVSRVFLWASPQLLLHADAEYILAGCEYLSELVLRLETDTTLSLLSRKPGGGVSNKRYTCEVSKTEFKVKPLVDAAANAATVTEVKSEEGVKAADPGGTFKIELDEDEMVARNALTLPYERTSDTATEGNIIYTPDADDDFDDEDPDEDLLI
ncbi:elongator complex protein 5 [Drosophila albomicans]|uniref:Elongator complex protein 5 n=1 Tax=Drosophila albomicans TaxID=7291 RepID=A0A6P8WX59_DROAB|nr:elongator complex protein 5 [Drosophila albomicans]